ncbi:Uncharacterised protein [Chlamydia trachomatis]|nr:Uncharacterised protein [Chlamydia trachomatis]
MSQIDRATVGSRCLGKVAETRTTFKNRRSRVGWESPEPIGFAELDVSISRVLRKTEDGVQTKWQVSIGAHDD